MERILAGRLGDFDRFVLSPQSDIEHFRHFLIDNGMNIIEEEMLIDEKKYYTIITAVPVKTTKANPDETLPSCDDSLSQDKAGSFTPDETLDFYKNDEDFIYGGILLRDKNETLLSFLQKEKLRYEGILEKTANETVRKSYEICLKALEAYR